MANKKITELLEDTAPTSDDVTVSINDPGGTPASKKATWANVIQKAHGLSNGVGKVVAGSLTTVTQLAVTDYPDMVGDSGAGGTKGAVPAPASGDATKYLSGAGTWSTPSGAGDVSSNTSSSVDSELTLFNSTTGKSIKRSAGTGIVKATSGVASYVTAPSGAIVGDTDTQTLTNKTLTDSTTAIADDGDATKKIKFQASGITTGTTRTLTVPDADITIAGRDNVETLTNKKLQDSTTSIVDDGDATKAIKFQASGITTGTTRTATMPDADITLVGTAATQALTNKDLTGAGNTFPTFNQDTTGKSAKTDGLNSATTVVNVSSATAPSAGQYLTATDSTHATWQTLSASKKVYTWIVAASGGDYTTLTAALAGASAGDTIFVRNGTYTETDPSTTLANITVIGENPETTILNYTTASLTFSGAKMTFFNIQFTFTTGRINCNGTDATFDSCHLAISGNNYLLISSVDKTHVVNCRISDTNTSTHTNPTIEFDGTKNQFEGNYCLMGVRVGDGSTGWLQNNGTDTVISGNQFHINSNSASSVILNSHGVFSVISNNNFNTNGASSFLYNIYSQANNCVISGNTFRDRSAIYLASANCSVTGNVIQDTSGTNAIDVQGGTNVISGNWIYGNTTAINVGNVANTTITGNQINHGTTGIVVGATATYTNIVGNDLQKATTAITDNAKTTKIKSNMGVGINDEKDFVSMKNTSGGSLALGDYVVFKSSVAAGNEFTTTTTASDPLALGMVAETIASTATGMVQILGKTVSLKANGTTAIAVGDFLTTYTAAGIVKKAASGDNAIAIALEAYSTADSLGVLDAILIPMRRI